ncbi:MAG: class I SAM-dependent methyltransferase [Chloroflexota bacterium]|jgi:2-polyprenyl-3-methyl-5-hydroxy-6-metoxy-1,4-benzoquinol methylase
MPVRTNILESTLFYTFNLAPAPLLDLAGALSYQAVATAAQLNLFQKLGQGSLTPAELAQQIGADERGIAALLKALTTIGYVNQKGDRYSNSRSTAKWLLDGDDFDLSAAVTYWNAILQELWPQAADIIKTGERSFNFYEWVEGRPEISHAFQQMMAINARLTGPDVAQKLALPSTTTSLLDVAGGHGLYSIILCQDYPHLQATILDSPSALQSANRLIAQYQLTDQIQLREGDLWQTNWRQDYDVILLFNLLHHFDPEANERLLQMAANALKSGGQVAIMEQMEGKVFGSASNAFVQLIALQYYLAVGGRVYSQEDIQGLLLRTGFTDIHFHKLTKSPGTSLAVAKKSAIQMSST